MQQANLSPLSLPTSSTALLNPSHMPAQLPVSGSITVPKDGEFLFPGCILGSRLEWGCWKRSGEPSFWKRKCSPIRPHFEEDSPTWHVSSQALSAQASRSLLWRALSPWCSF